MHRKLANQLLATAGAVVIGGVLSAAPVVNEQGDKIGMVDDLIIEPSEMVPYAILSVGGFLGVGERLVVVPFQSLKISETRIELPGATKDQLEAMPAFSYPTK